MISRRSFLGFAGLGTLAALWPFPAKAQSAAGFNLAQLRYRGGDWDPHPQYLSPIIQELGLRTSVEPAKDKRVISPLDPDLFFSPVLFMMGRYEFDPFTVEERAALRRFLTVGGFIFADDSLGTRGSGFDKSFREELKKILPGHELKRLTGEHSVYRSFYLLKEIGGRVQVNPYLEGITFDNFTPVIYCQNDLAGAWARDSVGRWLYPAIPGGEAQRSQAFKTGVNIVIYALTGEYKRDLIHHPFIKKRLGL